MNINNRNILFLCVAVGVAVWSMNLHKVVALAPESDRNKALFSVQEKQSVLLLDEMQNCAESRMLAQKGQKVLNCDDSGKSAENEISVQEKEKEALKKRREKKLQMKKLQRKRLQMKKLQMKKRRMLKLKKRSQAKTCSANNINASEKEILQKIVQAEAGNQDIRGRRLVANVILNRVHSSKFPSTIRKVVFSPRQFSPISDGSYYRVKVTEETKQAVEEALRGKDDSQGALYFMDRSSADSSNVTWFDTALTRLFSHQGHEFYK